MTAKSRYFVADIQRARLSLSRNNMCISEPPIGLSNKLVPDFSGRNAYTKLFCGKLQMDDYQKEIFEKEEFFLISLLMLPC